MAKSDCIASLQQRWVAGLRPRIGVNAVNLPRLDSIGIIVCSDN